MNISNKFRYLLGTAFALLFLVGCEKDGDKIFLSSIDKNDLVASTNNIVLTPDNASNVVLSLAWTKNTVAISEPTMSAPNSVITTIQASTDSEFLSNVFESEEANLSRAYLGAELNAVARNLSLSDVETTIYFRLKATTGRNITPVFSNVVAVAVTPYTVDMSTGYVLDKDKNDLGYTLASPNSDGIYKGFLGMADWGNFFLLEGDGKVWGNEADADPFLISSATGSWSMWYPGKAGCYYTVVNTVERTWSALYLPTLTASGDISGDLTFDRSAVTWKLTFTVDNAGTLNFMLNGTGKQYNFSTGTDDDMAIDNPIAFAGNGGVLTFNTTAQNISVQASEAGTYTLEVNLKDPNAWKYSVKSGSDEPQVIAEKLYLPGIDNLTRGGWTFDSFVKLYDSENQNYAGVVNINSEFGYTIHPEAGNWSDKYTHNTGGENSGTLLRNGDTNVPAPGAGLYLVEISTKAMTYKHTFIGNQIYVSGLNGSWLFDTPLTQTTTPGIYSGTINITEISEYGFSIYLVSDDWNAKFGGADGKLTYKGANITDDARLGIGTYTMTVDLINTTYTIL